jgi:hypothetical protein
MAGFRSITPNININTQSGQLRTELLNTFSRLDGQLSQAPYKLASQNGPVGNSGTAETDLMSTTINFGTLSQIGTSILIFACGQTNANANNKTLKLKFGSTTIFSSGAIAMNNKDWSLQAEIIFNGGGSQISYANFSYNGGTSVVDTNTSSESIANNVTLKFTGEGTVNDDISIYYYKAILLN